MNEIKAPWYKGAAVRHATLALLSVLGSWALTEAGPVADQLRDQGGAGAAVAGGIGVLLAIGTPLVKSYGIGAGK